MSSIVRRQFPSLLLMEQWGQVPAEILEILTGIWESTGEVPLTLGLQR